MAHELQVTLNSVDETVRLGASVGEALSGPMVIGLIGEMGSGKTTFVRGLAQGLCVSDSVNSPTYTLMKRYQGRLILDHYDAWMEGRERAVLADGAHELLGVDGVSVIEWADRIEEWLPGERLELQLQVLSPEIRRATLRWISVDDGLPVSLQALGPWIVPDESSEG